MNRHIERGADDQTFHDVIEAYCGALSYAPGETMTVHVSTHAAAYDVVVERWGGERTIAWAANTVPGTFHKPRPMPTNGCGWPTAIEIPIDESWRSGFHLITLRAHDGPDGRRVAHTGFVVRAGAQRQRAVLVLATNTWNVQHVGRQEPLHRRPPGLVPAAVGRGMLDRPEVERTTEVTTGPHRRGTRRRGFIFQEYRLPGTIRRRSGRPAGSPTPAALSSGPSATGAPSICLRRPTSTSTPTVSTATTSSSGSVTTSTGRGAAHGD